MHLNLANSKRKASPYFSYAVLLALFLSAFSVVRRCISITRIYSPDEEAHEVVEPDSTTCNSTAVHGSSYAPSASRTCSISTKYYLVRYLGTVIQKTVAKNTFGAVSIKTVPRKMFLVYLFVIWYGYF